LVVIAIIALLLAVVIPALSKAKNQAQAIICLSNLGQMSMGWTLYANDNDDNLVGGNTWGGWTPPTLTAG
jgi:competence protein ComGC